MVAHCGFSGKKYAPELALLKVRLPEQLLETGEIPSIRFHEAKQWVAKAYSRPASEKDDFDRRRKTVVPAHKEGNRQ